jgi:hypothetical protein
VIGIKTMKTFICNRSVLVLFGICLLLGTVLAPGAASAQADTRLVIRRAPDLGRNVVVQLAVDGQVTYITYGHTYSTMLVPGKHTIVVAPTPNAKWKMGTPITLDMISGQIYIMTARNDGSGHLTLMPRS